MYYVFSADEIDLITPFYEDPVYDVYCDDEFDFAPSPDNLIYEDYNFAERVVVKNMMIDVGSCLKWREPVFAPCVSETVVKYQIILAYLQERWHPFYYFTELCYCFQMF